jgi:hypothetical protein
MLRDRGLDPEALQKLSRPMGPTLGDKDGSNVSALAVGLLTFLNLELATKGRETVQGIMSLGKAQRDQLDQQSAAVAQQANYGEKRGRGREGMPLEKIRSDEEIEAEQRKKGGVQRWASIGRGLSIASVTLATQAPGVSKRYPRWKRGPTTVSARERLTRPLSPPSFTQAILIYWLSSISYTLVQTVAFNLLDGRTARRKVAIAPSHALAHAHAQVHAQKEGMGQPEDGRGKTRMSFAEAQAQASRAAQVGARSTIAPQSAQATGEGQQPSPARPAGPVRPAQTQSRR